MDDNERNLFEAIGNQNFEEVQRLVESGRVNINFKISAGVTPLVIAILTKNFDMVKYLVEHGAILLKQNISPETVDNPRIYNYLLQKQIIVMVPELKAKILKSMAGGSYPLFNNWDQKRAMMTSSGKDLSGGYLYDPVNLDDYTNKEYLGESPGNLIFMIKTSTQLYKAVGYETQNLVREPETDLYLDCDRDNKRKYYVSAGGDGRIRQENNEVSLDGPFYAKIVFEEGLIIYVMLNNLIGCLESGQRVFLAEDSGVSLDYTVSYGFAKKLKERDYENVDELDRELDLGIAVGADHCQAGTSKTIYNLYVCEGRDCL